MLHSDAPAFCAGIDPRFPVGAPGPPRGPSPTSGDADGETPTILVVPEVDRRTPTAGIDPHRVAVKTRRVDATMVRVSDASHDIVGRPFNVNVKVGFALEWFG